MQRICESLLITGGAGFIGSALIRHLLSTPAFKGKLVNLDAMTYAADPRNVESVESDSRYYFVEGDICDGKLIKSVIEAHGIDTIIHFAAESHVDRSIHNPEHFIHTNILGTYQLLEAVRSHPHIHFHHISTDEVFGSLSSEGSFTEESPYKPNSPYSASKASSDHLLRAYRETYGLSTTLSNCSNNYGPYQHPEKLIPHMISKCLNGEPLPVYGDGKNVRDWVFVNDHIEAVWKIVTEAAPGSEYNIGGRAESTNLELIHSLIEIISLKLERPKEELESLITFVEDRKGHDFRYSMDIAKIEKELKWTPKHTLKTGLIDTVHWYLDHKNWLESFGQIGIQSVEAPSH